MQYAFEIKTLVMVEAESEDEAWDNLLATAREALYDFDYERSPEDDKEDEIKQVVAALGSAF